MDELVRVLEDKEVEAYEKELLLWATLTTNANSDDRERCKPKKPECLCDIFGE